MPGFGADCRADCASVGGGARVAYGAGRETLFWQVQQFAERIAGMRHAGSWRGSPV